MKMKLVVLYIIAVFGIPSSLATKALPKEKTKKQPHLILIVADDLGWNDVSWHNRGVVTPHLEDLARSGVILNQSYVLPICTPTRSALLTGRYPFTLGRQHGTIRPSEPTGLTLNATLLPEVLKKFGYTTHAVGKWHLGFCSWSYTPTHRGFDTFYGYYNGAEDYFKHVRSCLHQSNCEGCFSTPSKLGETHFGLDLRNNTTPDADKEGIYSSHLFASYVKELLESRNPDDPMFLYLPFQNVHAPLMVPENYTKPYKHIQDFNRRIYLGMVTALDEAVGRVVEVLKTTEHYNNSVIVFTTDNGGTCHHGGNNWPLRGMKSTFWEGGTRGVAFVHSPLLNNSGIISNKLVHATDWFQTFVRLAGGATSPNTDGFDQWDAITGSSPSPRKHMVYNIDNTQQFRAAVRIGDFKLLVGNPGESDWTPPPEFLPVEKIWDTPSSHTHKTSLGNAIFNVAELVGYEEEPQLNHSKLNSTHLAQSESRTGKKTFKNNLRSQSRHTGLFVFSPEGSLYENIQQRHSYVLNSLAVSKTKATSRNPLSLRFNESSKRAKAHKRKVPSHFTNNKKASAEIHKFRETIFTLPLCKDQEEYIQGPPENQTEEKDELSWQQLLDEHLQNDMWLEILLQPLDFLKNDTEIHLYNVADDPEERMNLAVTEINTVKVLLEFLLKEMNRYVIADVPDEVPEANPKYWNNVWSPGWCKAK